MKFMKRFILLVLLFLLLMINQVFAQNTWSEPIYISGGDTPDLDIDRNTGNLHLVVMKNGVTYIQLNSRGNILQQEIVPGSGSDEGMMRFGASITVDSQGFPHIGYRVYKGNNEYDIYYIYKTASGWASPLKIASKVLRGYVVRLAVDGSDRVYFCHGSVSNTTTNTGPVYMYIIKNGSIIFQQNDIKQVRGDERYELDVSAAGIVDLVASDLSYPSGGGPIYYWRTRTPGGSLEYKGDQHRTGLGGENGSADIFVDASGNTHLCYGAAQDNSINRNPSLHYIKFSNGVKVRDVRVTADGELLTWKFKMGIGSIAANSDGNKIVTAYLQTEDGELRTRISNDGGATWEQPVTLSPGWNTAEARNKHLIRANGEAFYLVYPENGIKLRILGTPPDGSPQLSVNPTLLDFGSYYDELSFNVKNSGGGTLNWSLGDYDISWIKSIQPQSGSLNSGQSTTVAVQIDRANLAEGDYNETLSIFSDGGNSDINLQMKVSHITAWFINCGGSAYLDNQGNQWQADRAYTAGSYGYEGGDIYQTADPIQGTDADPLFQTERYGMNAYRFDVPNGDYEITLHFAEIYYKKSNGRKFSVKLENQFVLQNIDLYQLAGHDNALSYTFSTKDLGLTVSDNRIDLEFSNSIDVAKISAINVKVLVAAANPILAYSPAVFNFGTEKTMDTLTIRNDGGGILQWNIENSGAPWIGSIQPAEGSLFNGESKAVVFSIDRTGLEPGDYSAALNLQSNAGSENITINMNVSAHPLLKLSQTSLDFGTSSNMMNFQVENSGNGILNWTIDISQSPSWLMTVEPLVGSLAASQASSVAVTVDRTGLVPGVYNSILQVYSNADSQEVSMQLEVPGQSLITRRINCGSKTAYTDNAGQVWSADQAYTAGGFGYDGGNIYTSTDLISGTNDDALYQSERWGMTAYRFDLPNGAYQVALHFAEIYCTRNGQRLMNVVIEGENVLQNLDIFQQAGHDAALVYTYDAIQVEDGRLDVTFSSSREAAKISAISINSISSNEAQLAVNPVKLDFDSVQTAMYFTIANNGGDVLYWSAEESPDQTWITAISPSDGSLQPGTNQDVAVVIDRTNIADGSYSGMIRVMSNVGVEELIISMAVKGDPKLQVTPTALDFGTTNSAMNLEIKNIGSGELHWDIAVEQNQTWLSVSDSTGANLLADQTKAIAVEVNRPGMAGGLYNALLNITSSGGNAQIPITMKVEAATQEYVQRINCGSEAEYTDDSGKVWSADRAYSSGGFGYVGGHIYATGDGIYGTNADPLYQSERYDLSAYRFDVPNGIYQVTLHFAEIYYRRTGNRVMNVAIEGDTVLANLDIYRIVGHDRALYYSYTEVPVTDGHLDLTFAPVVDVPKISAIEVELISNNAVLAISPNELDFGSLSSTMSVEIKNSGDGELTWSIAQVPHQTWLSISDTSGEALSAGQSKMLTVAVNRAGLAAGTYSAQLQITSNGGTAGLPVTMKVESGEQNYVQRINCGGEEEYSDDNGRIWSPDQPYTLGGGGYIGGYAYATSDEIYGTSADPLYQSERYGMSAYRFDLPNGVYQVTLHFAEIYYNKNDARVMNVAIEGNTVLTNFDVYRTIGHDKALYYTYTEVPVRDGHLDLTFSAVKEAPKISAIEVERISNSASLSVNPVELDFGLTETLKTFTVKNMGGQAINWSVEENPEKTWITSIAPTSGSLGAGAEQAVTVVVDRSGMQEGDYSGVLKVQSSNSSQDVLVKLSAPGPAILTVTPVSLNFGAYNSMMKIDIKNSGGGVLNWSITESPDQSWLSLTDVGGVLTSGQTVQVPVVVDRSGLEIGEYTADLNISTANDTQTVKVTMLVEATSNYAQRINCGSANDYTDGNGNTWAADRQYSSGGFGYTGGSTYTTTDEIYGTGLDPLYQSEHYDMSAYRFDLPNGVYQVTLHFAEIYYRRSGERVMNIAIENDTVLTNLDIYKTIGHDRALYYSYTEVPVNDGTLDITFSPVQDVPKISAIEVISVAAKTPIVFVAPNILNFGSTETEMTFTVNNIGGGVLNWTAQEEPDQTWITSLSSTAGTLAGGMKSTVKVTIDRSSMSEGDYNAKIKINSNGGVKEVNINMSVPGSPLLTVSSNTLDFGSTQTTLPLEIKNAGGGELNWAASGSPDQPWFTILDSANGILTADQSHTIQVSIDRSDLEQGQYSGMITINSNGGSHDVQIMMDVATEISYVQRVNCGSSVDYSDSKGNDWQADREYEAGMFGYIGGGAFETTDPISNTESDPLYQTERYGMSAYKFDVPDGNYRVVLHFAEIYFTSKYQRKLNVAIEGQQILENLDIFRQAGHDAAVWYTFTNIAIIDGKLDIAFSANKDEAKISAIEVEYISALDFNQMPNICIEHGIVMPDEYNLLQNYPNPFNNSTVISYDLPEYSQVQLIIYNLLGQQVTKLVDEAQMVGNHKITWNGKDQFDVDLPSGVYVYQIIAGQYSKLYRMTLLK